MTYDGPKVFRAPYGNEDAYENFERTVLNGVSGERVAQYSDFGSERDTVRLWGTKETVSSSWERIEPGDFLFFYRDGKYTHAAEVLETEQNENLGRNIWPNFEGDSPWLCIIYLDEPARIDVDSGEIHDLAGYDIDYPMGFSPLNDMGVGGIRGKYGSVENLVYGDADTESEQDVPVAGTELDLDSQPTVSIPDSVLDHLYFDAEDELTATDLLDQISSALNAGKHVILTGPPGTGKTEVARSVGQYLASEYSDYYTGATTTTATADWSTFDTVGGYMPEANGSDGDLSFNPGQVLRCFKMDDEQRNDLLVIDEVNRSDIDKSFGQLFTLLSGQAIQLPYTRDGQPVEVKPAGEVSLESLDPHQYVMPSSWRLLGTMNTYDKTSLYEMSYAFMRRFAFIHVDAPTVPEDEDERRALLENYVRVWDLEPSGDVLESVGDIWFVTNTAVDEQKIGPAIVKDLISHVTQTEAEMDRALTQAVASYVFPQLEGVRQRERIVAELVSIPSLDGERMVRLADDVLNVSVNE